MSQLVTTQSGSHWYTGDGKPMYEVEMASKKGQMRATTLTDARKLNLYPSVTTVMRLLDKPSLTSWKIEQAILAALTLPRIDGETLDDHARRVVRDSTEQVEEAAKLGTLIHSAIEEFVLYGNITQDANVRRLIEPFMVWWSENCAALHYSEKCVVHHGMGYAGRVDCKAEIKGVGLCIIDFKSRKGDSKGVIRTYDEDGMQLSAYREADALTAPKADYCMSILINSQSPAIHAHKWTNDDIAHSFQCFSKLTDLWQTIKQYKPTIK